MPGPEKVLLVGVALKREAQLMASSLSELQGLAETAGALVVGEFSQILPRYHAGTLIGKGKIEEIAAAAHARKVKTVVFDVELSPAQQKNLEDACKAKIIDRTRLILDIFARRARTSEGRLQVELAQLSYMLPRLTGSWRGFSQQVGGIGTRGPGERKLEYERRHIQFRIKHLKGELEKVRAGREQRRRRRSSVPVPQAALVGYTNVGKSTLLNSLTRGEAGVYADDKLFATLDPTTRRVRLPEGSWSLVTDTVGFIQRLPTALIAAFRSTLEEARLADCLLLVSDASAPEQERRAQERAVEETLAELGAGEVPRVRVLNKADRLSTEARRDLRAAHPEALLISAETGEGVPSMLARLQEVIARRWVLRELELPAERRGLIREAYLCGQVLSEKAEGSSTLLRLRLTPENWERLQALVSSPK